MRTRSAACLAACLAIFSTAPGTATCQSTPDQGAADFFDAGYYAWIAGDYVSALADFESALLADGGDENVRDIALVTGEWYQTTEIAAHGTDPRWSPDGNYVSFLTPVEGGSATRVAKLTTGGPEVVADFPGTSASFAPDGGSIAFLRIRQGEALEAARQKARDAIEVRSRADFFRLRNALRQVDAAASELIVRDLTSGEERVVPIGDLAPYGVVHNPADGSLLLTAAVADAPDETGLYAVAESGAPRLLVTATSPDVEPMVTSDGRFAVYEEQDSVRVLDLQSNVVSSLSGSSPVVSADGSTIAFIVDDGTTNRIMTVRTGGAPTVACQATAPVAGPALSPNGDRVVFQVMPRENWELLVADSDGPCATTLTHDIQHDLFPRFLDDDTVLGIVGEGRHRRSFLYDVSTGESTRLFHNNTVRTVAPEYEWSVSPDGQRILIVSERDGNTISPERGLYLVDLTATVSKSSLLERIDTMKRSELALREFGETMYGPIRDDVQGIVDRVSTGRIYDYEADLFAFGSKYITQPGNAMAIAYLTAKLESFGYDVEQQWFEPRPGIQSANVVATLAGTVDPDVIYVVSSHFDSVERGPGADDNTSGTSALLEAARVLKQHPQAATIKFAFFTGEEAGLLGSREFVRRAVADGDKLVGALNNDMIGFANDSRLDNTIRYSNDGIRDIQHNAAMMFTNLITYDARYYKNTDAHAYYEAYGDIVGGIGSYPILSSPHYHQSHDVLETINHQLVAEVSKTTVATLVLLASSPSRLKNLNVQRDGTRATVDWTPAVESSIDHYAVTWTDSDGEERFTETADPNARLTDVAAGSVVSVRAVNARGLSSWDAARITVD